MQPRGMLIEAGALSNNKCVYIYITNYRAYPWR